MPQTHLSIAGEKFLINGKLVYSDIAGSKPEAHGLLMNARFIQGIFDDKADPARFARFGHAAWDPEQHTDDLIAALPEWYSYGLRAFTVGLQGGGPCFTVNNLTIHNNPFGEDGTTLDPAYAARLDRLIRAADSLGMVVIVSYFYGDQTARLRDGRAVRAAVTTASRFLRDGGYTNVIIEVANEHDIPPFAKHPLLYYPQGVAALNDRARLESGGLPVGCSGKGGSIFREVAESSDVILIHGNGCTRQRMHNMIREVRGWGLNRPIVCNEDSQAIGQMAVTYKEGVSWGYYNNMTKQEPPADWSVLAGEDRFFAWRMAEGIGIAVDPIPADEQYYLQGLEAHMTDIGQRWLRVASLYPESIDFVDFFRNGVLYDSAWDESFSVHFQSNWRQGGVPSVSGDVWRAEIHLRDGRVIERSGVVV
ncbi:MAG: hypothetical protein DWI57_07390 [Chloroflexi bacterium]|nr:MAG: hypothetical protein DWI57_07390 [Chloroflexota bacterium]